MWIVVTFVDGVMLGLVVAAVVRTEVTTFVGVAFTVSGAAVTGVPAGATGVTFAVSTVVVGVVGTGRVVHPQDAMSRIIIIIKPIQVFIN